MTLQPRKTTSGGKNAFVLGMLLFSHDAVVAQLPLPQQGSCLAEGGPFETCLWSAYGLSS